MNQRVVSRVAFAALLITQPIFAAPRTFTFERIK